MAELAVDLPVFIASPSDVPKEREVANDVIRKLGIEAARHQLLITPLRWQVDARPGVGRPQDWINSELLRKSELVIVIFNERLGAGSLEELVEATDQVFRGSSDDVFVYIRRSDAHEGDVAAFRDKLIQAGKYFFWEYTDENDFREALTKHLDLWLDRWRMIPPICTATLQHTSPGQHKSDDSGEGKLVFIRAAFRYDREPELMGLLGRCATALYQQEGPAAVDEPIAWPWETKKELWMRACGSSDPARVQSVRFAQMLGHLALYPTPLRTEGDDVFFSDPEWFYFFCAAGLVEAILANDVTAVESKPYLNSVHQYLAVLSRKKKPEIVATLQRWLKNEEGITDLQPIARNFAAYVLGMIEAKEAESALAWAAEFDEGKDVRLYCITSLGKLRSRRNLGLMQRLYQNADDNLRWVLGQAICRTIGIARYEL